MRRLTERPSNTHTPMLYHVESTRPSLIQMSTDYLGIVSNKQHAGTIRNKDATTTSRGRSTQDKCSSSSHGYGPTVASRGPTGHTREEPQRKEKEKKADEIA
ncbi:hypothetical protein PVAP13_3KG274127 [Panicum virgatum]|uniref:Uncharacterized protein n=1 Tax=Panicum virgatum TaxID=38727 RepID=A0A8T0V0I7_PANVG|nr:hypothetical protein PVAP13_3KG274127 [Panicum virgatum]